MKSQKTIWIVLVIILAAGAGYGIHRYNTPGMRHQENKTIYTCPMHPQIRQDHPGNCPICNMTLVPIEGSVDAKPEDGKTAREDGRPAFMEEFAPIHLTAYKEQLIGVGTTKAVVSPVLRTVSTSGRWAGPRTYVADIYSLDIPLVREGQKVRVTRFPGSGVMAEGRVSSLLPVDETQTRVRRVRILLDQDHARTPYVNVEIEVVGKKVLSVPVEAVMDTGTHTYVFVKVGDGHYEPREVVTGVKGDTDWEILSGLNEGEEVAVAGNFLLDADSRLMALRMGPGVPGTAQGHDHGGGK